MKDYQTIETAAAIPLPEGVRLATDGIAGTMREGLLAMAVSADLGVMTALMEEPVTAVAGPRAPTSPTAERSGTAQRTARWPSAAASPGPPPAGAGLGWLGGTAGPGV